MTNFILIYAVMMVVTAVIWRRTLKRIGDAELIKAADDCQLPVFKDAILFSAVIGLVWPVVAALVLYSYLSDRKC